MTPERFEWIERLSSRGLLVVGVLGLVLGMAWGTDGRLPAGALVAWISLLAGAKFVLAAIGARAGWRPWPALVAEGGAFAIVGYVAWSGGRLVSDGSKALVPLLACAALLMLGGLLRRRGSGA